MTCFDFGKARRHGTQAVFLVLGACAFLGACKPEGPAGPAEDPESPDGFSVTLQWNAPSEDAEGNPLEDLLGYRVHYRDASPANGPGATTSDVDGTNTQVTISDVPAGVWYFGVTAFDVAGNESAPSNEVQVEVGP